MAVLYGLELSFHPFSTCPSYREVEALPLRTKLARLRDPALRARLLERGARRPQPADAGLHAQRRRTCSCWATRPTTRRPPGNALDARAAALGVSPLELAYDLLVSGDGRTILFHPAPTTPDCSDANMAGMLQHDHTVIALGDGGAHYGLICDASYTTHALTYWTRDRQGGAGRSPGRCGGSPTCRRAWSAWAIAGGWLPATRPTST